jgi:hypothetical protein
MSSSASSASTLRKEGFVRFKAPDAVNSAINLGANGHWMAYLSSAFFGPLLRYSRPYLVGFQGMPMLRAGLAVISTTPKQ